MGGGQTLKLFIMSGVYAGGGMSSWTIQNYFYSVYLFISRPTVAIHLCASAGQKTGLGALRKYKSDASDAPDAMLMYT